MPDYPRYAATPVPQETIDSLVRTVIRIEGRVKSIQEEQLPPVASAAKEARDGVIVLTEHDKALTERIKSVESKSFEHDCLKEKEISAHEKEIAGLSKWRWWLMGLIVTAAMIAASWATGSSREMATVISDQAATQRDVARIEEASKANHREMMQELRSLPGRIKESPMVTIERNSLQPVSGNPMRPIRDLRTREQEAYGGGE
jgi:hypothetical protein